MTCNSRWMLAFCLLISLGGSEVAAQESHCSYANGRISESRHDVFSDKGLLSVRITYTYDTAGVVLYRTLTSFDEQGHIQRREQYTASDYLLLEEDFKYDRRGNLVKRVSIFYDETTNKSDKTVETRRYTYASDGTILHATYLMNGQIYHEL